METNKIDLTNYKNIDINIIIDELINFVKSILSKNRFEHTINVLEKSLELAEIYKVDKKEIAISAILHDITKNLPLNIHLELLDEIRLYDFLNIKYDYWSNVDLLHGPTSAFFSYKTFHLKEKSILSNIFFHTTGKENMSKSEKIIFIADMVEKNRNYYGIEKLRELVIKDLNLAVCYG